MESEHLSDREKAAVLWAEHVTKNTAKERDDVFDHLKQHFDEAEIVELTLMSGMFNMFNRFMDSLQIDLEVQGEVDKIKRSLNLDPEKVRTYLGTVLKEWPAEFPEPNKDD